MIARFLFHVKAMSALSVAAIIETTKKALIHGAGPGSRLPIGAMMMNAGYLIPSFFLAA